MATKKIDIGSKAPNFKLQNQNEDWIQLKDFKGKTVVLFFYPKDLTPGCTQEACDFTELKSRFSRKKAILLGVSKDSTTSHQKFIAKHDLKIDLLSDPDGECLEAYGVWKEKSLYGRKFMGIERTTVVISEDGTIQAIYPKVKVKGHAEAVLEAI